MIVITTRSYPPELGGTQSLMGSLAIHINNFIQLKFWLIHLMAMKFMTKKITLKTL
jgi:hypothetical protein